MIWVRRFITIPNGVLLFVLLLVTLVVLQINGTSLDPDYYPEELRKANIYEFALVDLLTSALDEARELDPPEDLDENPLVTSGLSTQDIVSSVNRAVPPEWVQGLVEQSFDQFGKYLTGERDEFEVTVRAGDQVVTVKDEVKALLRKADAFELLFERAVDPAVEGAVDIDLPFNVPVSGDRLVQAVRTIVPPQWVQQQVEYVLDEVTPYVVGERDTFELHIQLSDRGEVALIEVKKLLRETDAYELLYDQVIAPQVKKRIGDGAELLFGVTITTDEILDGLRRVAPPEWVAEQAEMVIDSAGPYLTGKADSFTIEVSLVDNKREAEVVLAELADKKVTELIDSLPKCASPQEAAASLAGGSVGLPACIPPDVPVAELISRSGIDILGGVRQAALGPIPDNISFTDSQLRTTLELAGAGENLEKVDQVREILKDGWTYTQDDLRSDIVEHLGEGELGTLDDLRAFLADGWKYSHTDFSRDLSERDPNAAGTLDDVRGYFKSARTFRWVVYLPLLLLMVMTGFLGGRSWSSRVAWAAGSLTVSAAIVFVIFGPGYDTFAKSGPIYDAAGIGDVDELRRDSLSDIAASGGDFPNTSRLVANKMFDIAESMVDGFASGIASSSRNLAVVGLIVMVAAIFWGQIMMGIGRLRAGGEG